MNLDGEAARRAFEPLAARFNLGIEQAASSALQLADANIVRAIQLVSTSEAAIRATMRWCRSAARRPLHAARIAEELGISTIVVPPCRRDLGLRAGRLGLYQVRRRQRKMKLDDAAAKQAGRISMTCAAARRAIRDMKLPATSLYAHARHAFRRPGFRSPA